MDAQTEPARDLDATGRLVGVKAACDYLSLSRTSIYKLMDAGELEFVKLGRSRRIPVAALLALVERNRTAR